VPIATFTSVFGSSNLPSWLLKQVEEYLVMSLVVIA